jgi:hypothetical protein
MAKSYIRPSIAFDTTPMIWGVRQDSDPDDDHWIAKATQYIRKIESEGYSIMVPSPVISEYLVGATDTQFKEAKILRRGFLIADLDSMAATLAAQLQRGGIVEAIHDEFGTPKKSIRIDAFIIAIACVQGASKIITNK